MEADMRVLVAAFFFFSFCLPCRAQTTMSKEPEALILYGDDWVFSVKEPSGWFGNSKDAYKVPANVVFYPKAEGFRAESTWIYIQLTSKTSEDMNKELISDMEGFRKRYKDAIFKDIIVSHRKYPLAPKLFIVPKRFCEYVTYLNPGSSIHYKLAIIMHTNKREATDAEMAAYREILASINWWEGVVPTFRGK
jgi:hypothetical protein